MSTHYRDVPFQPDRPAFSGQAVRAIVRNASAADELPVVDVVVADGMGLAEDGSDYNCALNWLMTFAGFSEAVRSFVFSVAGLIERDGGEDCPITDPEFAEHLNCSERTIIRRRQKYQAEEQMSNFSILAIREGDYDQGTGKNEATRYALACLPSVVATVQRARGSHLWERGQTRAAIKAAARAEVEEITEAPPAGKRRRQKTRSIESELDALQKTILTLAGKMRDLEGKRPAGDVPRLRAGLTSKIERVFDAPVGFGGALLQSVDSAEPDPPGCQPCHPVPEPPDWPAPVEAEAESVTPSFEDNECGDKTGEPPAPGVDDYLGAVEGLRRAGRLDDEQAREFAEHAHDPATRRAVFKSYGLAVEPGPSVEELEEAAAVRAEGCGLLGDERGSP